MHGQEIQRTVLLGSPAARISMIAVKKVAMVLLEYFEKEKEKKEYVCKTYRKQLSKDA